jgi:hypothetical protein
MEQSCEKLAKVRKKSRQWNYTVPILMVITASHGHSLLDQHFKPKSQAMETELNHVENFLYIVNNESGEV